MTAKLVNIATAVPDHRHEQTAILDFMIQAHGGDDLVSRQLRMLYQRSGIDTRYSVLPDFDLSASANLFMNGTVPGISDRLQHYQKSGVALATEVAQACLNNLMQPEEVTHLITVSCTGLYAPGLEMDLMHTLGLSSNVQRHPINFVGCYAAIPALNLAQLICTQQPKAKVLVVSVELCTLHFQAENTRDNYTANALFADGAGAALVVGEAVPMEAAVHLGTHYGEVNREGVEDMAWIPSEQGFLMRLSSYIPKLIEQDIASFVERSLQATTHTAASLDWAFHPGGLQILHKLQAALGIETTALTASYEVLRAYGNMSSATLFFVIKALLEQPEAKQDIYCCAFGPGLTFESLLLYRV